jgi:hypothetical protein
MKCTESSLLGICEMYLGGKKGVIKMMIRMLTQQSYTDLIIILNDSQPS